MDEKIENELSVTKDLLEHDKSWKARLITRETLEYLLSMFKESWLFDYRQAEKKIEELESERECLSKWLIEARMEIVELEEVG